MSSYLTRSAQLIDFHELQFIRNWRLPRCRILVTGGLGFIFGYVVEWLHMSGHEVVVLDNESDGADATLGKDFERVGIKVIRQDVATIDPDKPLYEGANSHFDFIIHAAAESDVDKSIAGCNRHLFVDSNVAATFRLLEWAQQRSLNGSLKKFFFVNTDEVYGSRINPARTSDPIHPSSLYSAAKASAGLLCHSYNVTHSLPIMEWRMCNIIGHRQALTKILPKAINCLLSGKPFPVHGDGTATREYMDVRQVPMILEYYLWLAYHKLTAEDNGHSIYNITSSQEHSIGQVLMTIENVFDLKLTRLTAARKGIDMHYRMVRDMMLGGMEFVPLEDTIRWMGGKAINHPPKLYAIMHIDR